MPKVRFEFLTGVKRELFNNVFLQGNWSNWQRVGMASFLASDGCWGYQTQVDIDDAFIGKRLQWGLRGDGPLGTDLWLIPTEVKHPELRDRHREFTLQSNQGVEVYRLNLSRYLGANKVVTSTEDLTRFSVWAPNAKMVEVVFGSLWDRDSHDLKPYDIDLNSPPLAVDRISGGYISDDGAGIHTARPTLQLEQDRLGIWHSNPTSPKLPFVNFDHRLYMYRVTRADDSKHFCTDIYSRCQVGFGKENPGGRPYYGLTQLLDGSVSCSAIVDPDKVTEFFEEDVWPERNFIDSEVFWESEFPHGNNVPKRLEDLVIYELHVGALGFGKDGPGTLKDALTFLDYLQDLGVNAVELLPMAEFGGGAENWGYATSHYFAIEYGGGGRDKYKFFIRECHRRGIAVIMDVVFNHYVHSAARAQWQYDSTAHDFNSYYWYEGNPNQYEHFNNSVTDSRRGTGGYVDNQSTGWAPRYHEELIRQMFISSMIALVEEFHVDGFRVDQTTSIHTYNGLHANGDRVANANAFGAKLLRELTRTLKMIKPEIILTAEDHSDDLSHVVRSTDQGGLGFDAAWYSNYYHSLIGDTNHGDQARLLAESAFGDDRELNIDGFAGALSSTGHSRVIYHESHDEAGNGSGTARTIRVAVNCAPLIGETRFYAEARSRFVAGITSLSAGTPMFLFGEEVGAEKDFLYDRVLENREDLQRLRHGVGSKLFEFYRQLTRLRLRHAGLRSRNLEIVYTHNQNRILAFRRWSDKEQHLIVASLNNRPFDQPHYFLETPLIPAGKWAEIFNSDSANYGGANVGNGGRELESQANGFWCVVPSNGFVVFQRSF